jgi:3-oxoacyl-[acyl-carrier-protein] synthase-3
MSDAAINLMDKNNLTANDIDFFVPHQANQRIIDATAQRTGVDPEKVLSNIVKYGNTTAATLPLILSDFEHRFKKGDNVMFAAFGGGFTWGAAWLKWAYNT